MYFDIYISGFRKTFIVPVKHRKNEIKNEIHVYEGCFFIAFDCFTDINSDNFLIGAFKKGLVSVPKSKLQYKSTSSCY